MGQTDGQADIAVSLNVPYIRRGYNNVVTRERPVTCEIRKLLIHEKKSGTSAV